MAPDVQGAGALPAALQAPPGVPVYAGVLWPFSSCACDQEQVQSHLLLSVPSMELSAHFLPFSPLSGLLAYPPSCRAPPSPASWAVKREDCATAQG